MDMKLAETIKDLAYDKGFEVDILPEYRLFNKDETTVAITISNPIALAELILHAPYCFMDRDGQPDYEDVRFTAHATGLNWVVY